MAPIASAQERSAEPEFSLQGLWTGIDPSTGRDDATFAMSVFAGERDVRIDLPAAGSNGARMIVDRGTGEGWVFDPGEHAGMPIRIDFVRQMVVDPGAPCANLGVVCHEAPPRSIAGRTAAGWRYAGAGRRGPGGSHAGTMWVDSNGIVVGYEGRTRERKVRRMRATSLDVGAVPAESLRRPASTSPR